MCTAATPLGEQPFLVNMKLKDAIVYPPNTKYQKVETTKKYAKEDYMEVFFPSGLNHNRYVQFMNELHNAFRIGQDYYPKMIISVYGLVINWKGNTGSVAVHQDDGVVIVTDDRGKDGYMHATDRSVILTRYVNPVECHICGLKHFSRNFPGRENSYTQGNKYK